MWCGSNSMVLLSMSMVIISLTLSFLISLSLSHSPPKKKHSETTQQGDSLSREMVSADTVASRRQPTTTLRDKRKARAHTHLAWPVARCTERKRHETR